MFRVYTEDTLRATAKRVALAHFGETGFTLTRAIGCWRNRFERSQCFEIDTKDAKLVYMFARALKVALKQSTVLVVELQSTSTLV